jgi:diaminohydroxyphosphoribosylaminopyrimidine deaminase/5-amino-6-(5-phosphoribosylamino)uracil reductase
MSEEQEQLDITYMKRALELAQSAYPAPNPQVSAVIVKNNKIIGEGFHKKAGESHAEIIALQDVEKKGMLADGATMYVTLEPCCHFGKTPPCIDAIIVSGIKRIVIGCVDQNPLVNGAGISGLIQAGMTVNVGICGKECSALYKNFFHVAKTKLPYITLKSAITLDGKIASAPQTKTEISSQESRNHAHELRRDHDAVLVGIGTVLADNPQLNCRIPCKKQPTPVIVDSTLKMPENAKVLKYKPIIVTTSADKKKHQHLEKKGARIVKLSGERVNIKHAMQKLPEYGILSVLVEGGSEVNAVFFREKLVNRVCVFIAPKLFGAGVPLFAEMKHADHPVLKNVTYLKTGTDICVEADIQWQNI